MDKNQEKVPKPIQGTDPVILAFPFKTATGQTIDVVQMRRATVKDRRLIGKQYPNIADQEVALVARLAGLVPEDLDAMDATDWSVVQSRFLKLVHRNDDGNVGGDGIAGEVVPVSAE